MSLQVGRNGIYEFRKVIPEPLRPIFGKREFKKSLGTRSLAEARSRMAGPAAQYEQLLANAKQALAGGWSQVSGGLVSQWLDDTGRDERWLRMAVARLTAFCSVISRDDADLIPPAYAFEHAPTPEPSDRVLRLKAVQARTRMSWSNRMSILAHLETKAFEWIVSEVAVHSEREITKRDPLFNGVAHDVRRRMIEASIKWMNRDQPQEDLRPSLVVINGGLSDAAPDGPTSIAGIQKVGPTSAVNDAPSNLGKHPDGMQPLSVGLQRWKELKKPGASAIVEADRAVARFIELYGDNAVALITDDEIYDYRDFLEKMPANLSLPAIQASGFRLREAVKRAWEEKPDREKLSPGSVKKDIGALSAIFTALKGERWIKVNAAAGISISGYSKKRKGQKNPRLPLRPNMMRALFASTLFTGCAGRRDIDRTKPGPHVYQDELYWTFLFGATAGPRLEEVGQILLDDIEVLEEEGQASIAAIYVTGTGEDQSAKTDESIRVIIVHPRLVELGFLSFVKQRREAGATRLFDLKKSTLGTWSKELSRRINRYLDRTVVDDKRYVWYSMRHEFADRSEINISEAVSRKIMGHARGRLYGLGAPLHHAARELAKLDVSFIDWDRLMIAAGRAPKQLGLI